ncbi:glycosyltransferase [Aggregicoccus sp. 17bor-14]|uniref:glycosyltransferase n=1 Tax=Myxococcaceae TaxID=31 RepID=UPI00129C5538|nr:glycosyltransferase [Simulacricoccus sp. 17bor-14]MRI88281.1 glycosyltransferase [Aggregicoccus sp. 17bor-14]
MSAENPAVQPEAPGVLDALRLQRLAQRLQQRGVPMLPSLTQSAASLLTRSHLPLGARIGEGTVLEEGGRGVFLHPRAEVGAHCRIGQDVMIGEWRDAEAPRVGDHVQIGAGAKLVGAIRIGEGAVIGPNAVVDRDVAPFARLDAGSNPELFTGMEPDVGVAGLQHATEILEMPSRNTVRPDAPSAPIRLAQFTRAFYLGGTEVQIVELLRGLGARYQVSVGVLDLKGPLLAEVERLGHVPRAFPLTGGFARPNTALQIARLAAWLRKEKIELVHVHDYTATLVAVPAAKLAGCKVIVGRLDLAHWHNPAQRLLLTQLSRMADHVIGNAELIRTMLVEGEGIPAHRVSVVHNGLDLPRFDARRREGLKAPLPDTRGAPVVIHVANMNHPVKRQEDLLAAVAQVNRFGQPLHAYLVGDGPRRGELELLARTLGVADKVHFLGHRTDVPAIYERGTFGVLCSTHEGLSNAIMEGMASALPMVVTHAGGNPELVKHEERGLVVPVEAPVSLANAFSRLLKEPAWARQMGVAGRAFVERELTLQRMVAAHDAVYRHVARGETLVMPRESAPPVRLSVPGKEQAAAPSVPLEAQRASAPEQAASAG